MKVLSAQAMTELMELTGHVLDNRERVIVSNLLMNYRNPDQLAKFLNIPKLFVIRTGKFAMIKIRNECISQLRAQGAPEQLIMKTVSGFTVV